MHHPHREKPPARPGRKDIDGVRHSWESLDYAERVWHRSADASYLSEPW